jgi:predicted phage terminase large subunit-like protein
MSPALTFKTDRERKIAVATAIHVKSMRAERKRQSARGGLYHFVRYFWNTVEPNTDLIDGWCLRAICQHLEAVHYRDITRLLMNVPPGSMKSLITNVFYPAWAWSAGGKPGERFLSFSYASFLSERDNERMLMVLKSSEFKEMWGGSLTLTAEGKVKISNNHRGWKFATSVGGVGTGERGSVILFDDPNPVNDSQKVIESTVTWFRETLSNRLNDMRTSAIVVIMQRISEEDVSGAILGGDDPYVHLMIPMLYEPDRHCKTSIGWSDPRTEDGECYWPERFPPEAVARCKAQGAYAWASQYRQSPEIRGGGIFKRDDWQDWDDPKWPKFDYIVASLDPAFTAKQQNDPSGFTIWGCFSHEGEDCAMLLHAWRKWLPLHGPDVDRVTGETDEEYRERSRPSWGLVETVAEDCRRFKAAKLLIENKASGHDVSTEMHRLHTGRTSYEFVDPKGLDKHARAVRIQPEFSNGQIWARKRKKYAVMVIDEMAIFPKGKYDDLCDSTSQVIWWLRSHGFLKRRSEKIRDRAREASKYQQQAPIYEC